VVKGETFFAGMRHKESNRTYYKERAVVGIKESKEHIIRKGLKKWQENIH
jgi:hypothetical protein